MSLAVAFAMPFVMLALVFMLARIEDRHLVNRSRVLTPAPAVPAQAAAESQQTTEAA
ncbi:MAG: hypothetical protein ACT4QG_00695 [Sporichthyaceae bacterium]